MGDSGSGAEVGESRVARAFGTSVRGNSTAFGFPIMITVSFGMVNHLAGAPNAVELLLFGVGAAVGIAALEGVLTKGFRARIEQASQEVQMLGTAMNFASVAAGVGVGAALAVAELMGGTGTWPVAAFAAAMTYIGAEGLELVRAEQVHAVRGAPVKSPRSPRADRACAASASASPPVDSGQRDARAPDLAAEQADGDREHCRDGVQEVVGRPAAEPDLPVACGSLRAQP